MTLSLPGPVGGRPPVVVVTHPTAHVALLVHHLRGQGATVVVATDDPSTDLLDLAGRGLTEVVPASEVAGAGADVVVRDPGRETDSPAPSPATTGLVTLVGGGPGDPGLITVAGLQAIREADVVVCDRLAPLALLDQARPDAEVVHVGKIPRGAFTPQEDINAVLVDRAQQGLRVVRLKGGDNYVFGRGGEELLACRAVGIPVRVVPGVSSALAVPALAGIPLTHRGVSTGFVVVTGHLAPDREGADVDWKSLAHSGLGLVVLMGGAALAGIAAELVTHGMDPATPVACLSNGSLPDAREVRGTLADIAEQAADLPAPMVTVIGTVVTVLEENA